MKIETIKRYFGIFSVVFFFVCLFISGRIIAKAASPDIIDQAFEKIGTTQEEFFPFCFGKIENFFSLTDAELQKVGIEQDLSGIFKKAKEDTFELFENVETEEEAFEILNGILQEVEK